MSGIVTPNTVAAAAAPAVRPYLWSPWAMAEQAPNRMAVAAGDEAMSYGELVAEADRLGAALCRLGARDGSVVSTDLVSGPRMFALALAALKYGLGLFPISPRSLVAAGVEALLTRLDVSLHVGSARPGRVPVVDYAVLRDGALPQPPAPGREGFLVYLTSGTTGAPRIVARTRPWHRYRGVAVFPKYGAGPQTGPHVMGNPTFHLGTLGPALYALQAGAGVVVERQWSAGKFVELVDRYRADSAFLSADQLVDLAYHPSPPRHRPTVVFHGGSACAPAVKRRTIDLLGPILHEYYGVSETVVTEISSAEWLHRPGSVGRPLPGVEIEIRDDRNRSVETGELGEVWVLPRPINRTSADRPLRTGDLGYIDEQGYLFVLGRLVAAGDYRHARLAHAISVLPAVTDVAVTGDDSAARTVCLVESGDAPDPDLPAAIGALAADLGLPAARVLVQPHGTFPRTPSGKLRSVDPTVEAR